MRTSVILSLSIFLTPILSAQVRYTGEDFREYFQWFNQYSQTADFYTDQTQLYTFNPETAIHTSASFSSSTLLELPAGYTLRNRLIPVDQKVESKRGGYGEEWFAVSGSYQGQSFNGYVWGGDLAKAWRTTTLPGLSGQVQVLLGLSSQVRKQPSDLRASLRLVNNGRVQQDVELPGTCVFADCDASTLLRVLNVPQATNKIFEVSVMTSGCLTGLDKSYISWDGRELQLFYQGEWTTGTTAFNNPVYLQHNQMNTQVCYFSREDINYNPVWNCEDVKTAAMARP